MKSRRTKKGKHKLKIALFAAVACWCYPVCLPAQMTSLDATVPEMSDNNKRLLNRVKRLEIGVVTEECGLCPGPDGKAMPFLGRNARLQIVLKISMETAGDISPDRLFARIGDLKIPFFARISEEEYLTDVVRLDSLGSYPNTGPEAIAIFYREGEEEFCLGRQQLISIDTTPPPRIVNLRFSDLGSDGFLLQWDLEREPGPWDIKEFILERWEDGQWKPVVSGIQSPNFRVNAPLNGRIRVVALDCALNRSYSEELDVDGYFLKITNMKVLAPHKETEKGIRAREDKVALPGDKLAMGYAVEVTANRECKILLVNIDSKGFGFRLFPTPCRTGRGFKNQLRPAEPMRFPPENSGVPYVGLDEVTGIEKVYAIVYQDEAVKDAVWRMVPSEICEYPGGKRKIIPNEIFKELMSGQFHRDKEDGVDFDVVLDRLMRRYRGKMHWARRDFVHY